MTIDAAKRHALTIGLATLGVGAGLATYLWQSQSKKDVSQQDMLADKPLNLWEYVFDTPIGTKLEARSLRGKPLLINFWATWCPPCVEELPLLERFFLENKSKSIQLLGIAVDKPKAVAAFLHQTPLSFPIGISGMEGIALSKSWGNLSGGLPFSIMLSANGRIMQRKIGKLSQADLDTWQIAALR